MVRAPRLSPASRLLVALLLALVVAVLAMRLAVSGNSFGMALQAQGGDVQIVRLAAAPAGLSLPQRVLGVSGGGKALALEALDVIEEPDLIDSYRALERFLGRQQQLHEILQAGRIVLALADGDGNRRELGLEAGPTRALASLPLAFWIQLATGIGGFVIGGWVLALRPGDGAARCFMLTGFALMCSALSAAIYSSRELALSAELWRALTRLNEVGGVGFGFALAALFLLFPRRLGGNAWLWLAAAGFAAWLLVEFNAWSPSPQLHIYPVIAALGLAVAVLIALQWRRNRGRPLERAALRWFGLAALLTVSLFVALQALPAILGQAPVLSQGSTFGLFLILYAGLALGLTRHRLFELDRWAFRVLFWALAALALIALDLALVTLLHWGHQLSLSAALLICGLLYLPARAWLWRRMAGRRRPGTRELFNRIVAIALAPSEPSARERWRALLAQTFDALELRVGEPVAQPRLSDDGLELRLPATAHTQPLVLRLAGQGQRLFSREDVALAGEMVEMLAYATDNRNAWQEGARQERQRIAQDLHDDLGSRLLTGLHQSELPRVHETLELALADMRSIVRGLAGQDQPLELALAELRQECAQRCEAAGVTLDWPPLAGALQQPLAYRAQRELQSALRELLSNVLRHAGARHVRIQAETQEGWLELAISNDGIAFDGATNTPGLGLDGLRRRIGGLGGALDFQALAQGAQARLRIPLAPMQTTGTGPRLGR